MTRFAARFKSAAQSLKINREARAPITNQKENRLSTESKIVSTARTTPPRMVNNMYAGPGFKVLGATLSLNRLAAGMALARARGQRANVKVISKPKATPLTVAE